MKRITTLLTLMLLTGALSIVGAPAASATTIEGPSLNIPVGTVVRGDVGSSHVLGSVTVPEELRGMVCEVHATATNQGSVHPGNDIVVSSNGASVTLHDVEREGFVSTTADATLQLGGTLSATLIMGKDKVFSGGIVVTTTCIPPPPEPVSDVVVVCAPETGITTVVLANIGEASFVGTILNSDSIGTEEEIEPGDSISFAFEAGESWLAMVNGDEVNSGVAEYCLITTTTTAPPVTTTTEPPAETTTTSPPDETTTTTIPEVETDLAEEGISPGGILWLTVVMGTISVLSLIVLLIRTELKARRED